MPWTILRAATFLLLFVVGPSCGSSSSSPRSGPEPLPFGLPPPASGFQPPSKPLSDTPWAQELDNVAEDGTRTKESALRLFAIAFGALPGVDAMPNGEPIVSTTAAIRAVEAHRAELTTEQQAAIDARLAVPSNAVVIRIDPAGAHPEANPSAAGSDGAQSLGLQPQAGPGGEAIETAIRDAAIGVRARTAAKLGADIPGAINVVLGGVDPTEFGHATFDFNGSGGAYSGCHVTITELAVAGGAAWILDTLAHEIFHCFEAHGYRTAAAFVAAPGWVIEGGAQWAGHNYTATLTPPDLWWSDYLGFPSTSLLTRTYDAVGVWTHLEETGTDPWTVFPAVFRSSGGKASFQATGAPANATFLDSWASSTTRDPARGPAWDTNGPGITDASAPVKGQPIAHGDRYEFDIKPFALGIYALFISADVLVVTANGHARMSDGKVDTTAVAGAWCVKEGGCDTCEGSNAQPLLAPLLSDPVLALTGGVDGTSGTLAGLTFEDFCKKDDKKHVWVHAEREAVYPMQSGRVLELAGCNGKIGPWSGAMRLGGLDTGDGFVVPWVSLPMSFVITAEGAPTHTTVSGTIPTPVFDLDVVYELDVVVQGGTMSITGTSSGDNGMFGVADDFQMELPIEPSPAGICP